MTATKTKRPSVEELIAQFEADGQDAELMARHQAELEARVAAYESKYGIPSSEVHAAIERKELRETLEVCDWLMDYHSLVGKTADDFR